ncbi:unnamed protein product, partial [Adineta steineri]
LLTVQRDIFPYAIVNNATPSKDKGLSELVRLCFGKPLNKSEQCSNWERRPLRSAQLSYAVRGKKPKKLDSAIAREIDKNWQDTNNNNDSPQKSDDVNQISAEMIRPSQIKFVVDNMLHGLGKELRVAGCDPVIL